MQDWKHKLLDERDEVISKILKLENFVTELRPEISEAEHILLVTQLHLMRAYSNVLNARVASW